MPWEFEPLSDHPPLASRSSRANRGETGFIQDIFAQISPHYDLMNDLESLGLHRLWKRRLVRSLAAASTGAILDVACGTGDIAIALAQAYPRAKITAVDFCPQMLELARRRAAKTLPPSWRLGTDRTAHPQNNLHFCQADALALPFADSSFAALSISFGLRNLPDYAAALREFYRVLRPGGILCCLDSSMPKNPLVKLPHRLYLRNWLPLLAKMIANQPSEYAWLYESTQAFLSKRQLAELLRQTGFEQVRVRSFLLGAAAMHSACKPRRAQKGPSPLCSLAFY